MTLHADQIEHSKRIGANLRSAGEQGLLTNTTVAAADTNAGLQAAVDAASVHADANPAKDRIKRAIDYGKQSDELSDANILGLTTLAGAEALTQDGGTGTRREQMP
jgi:hypothetical protein